MDNFKTEATRFVEALKAKDRTTFDSFLRKDLPMLAILPMGIFDSYESYRTSQDH